MEEILVALLSNEILSGICSKIDGRRNWVIRVEKNYKGEYHILYAGAYGIARDRGLLEESLAYMAKHQTKWLTYTYKKDYKDALKKLNNYGIE